MILSDHPKKLKFMQKNKKKKHMIGHVFTSREGKINTKIEVQVNFILKKKGVTEYNSKTEQWVERKYSILLNLVTILIKWQHSFE